jgi:polyhydroxybutyrate depolymerase
VTSAFLVLSAIACGVPDRHDAAGPARSVVRSLGGREYALDVPSAASLGGPVPLIVLLHGYGSSGQEQATYFGLDGQAAKRGFLLAKPDGTRDSDGRGRRYWNAFFPDCCTSAAGSSPVDDVAFLLALIRDVELAYPVDPDRVYLMGHSNGAFMAYRMACDHAETFAGVVAVAGAVEYDHCHPSRPVSIAAVHGTGDRVIQIGGGRIELGPGHPYASLAETLDFWVRVDRCARAPVPMLRDDLVSDVLAQPGAIPGAETDIERASGCVEGADVEAWRMAGAGHVPAWNAERWPAVALDFLLKHRRAQRLP